MSATIKTCLIIGATSGLGEQFARRFHSMGKNIIITGRRAERLDSIKSSLASSSAKVESYTWDVTDFDNISSRSAQILTEHPDINSVFLVAGVGSSFSFLDPSTSMEAGIISECNTNMTAYMLLTRAFLPHLASVAAKGNPASLILTGSGLGFVPVALFPSYCATKAATHSFALALRQQVNQSPDENIKKNLSIVEVVPPFVDTDFAKGLKLGPNAPKPMGVEEYMEETMAELEKVDEENGGKPLKEVAAGSAKPRVELWRGSIGKHMNGIGLDC